MRSFVLMAVLLAEPAVGTMLPEVAADFTAADWWTVREAEMVFEDRQAAAIPILIAMLGRDEVVKLENTADLIYPGAKTFHGHGSIVSYDLDYLPARAGWALEELTFENFGFEGAFVEEEDLRAPGREGKMDVPMEEVVPRREPVSRQEHFAGAVRKATEWWRSRNGKWSRFEALREALASGDPWRQLKALNWLRFGMTRCDGLDPLSFNAELRPLVEKLGKSASSHVREQAGHLLDAGDTWYGYKADPRYRYGSDGVESGVGSRRP